MRLAEPYETERQARDALRPLFKKSQDHAAAVQGVFLKSVTHRSGMRICTMTAVTAASVLALFHREMPWPAIVLASIATIGSSVVLAMHATLHIGVKSRLSTLARQHPYRLRQILTEIREHAPAIRDAVDAVEREYFGDKDKQ